MRVKFRDVFISRLNFNQIYRFSFKEIHHVRQFSPPGKWGLLEELNVRELSVILGKISLWRLGRS